MFINSIFLPKNISDHTLPEGISSNIGDFSHLFSNVFRIVNDEQESAIPFKLLNVEPDSTVNTQNQLLKVSLLSDNKLTQEDSSISMLVSLFMSKIKPGDDVPELADANKVKVSEKTPKYFSLNKNELIKEIKNILKSLNNGDAKNLENIEISLIANGQSIKLNPLTTNIVDLENWISEQVQTNSDFEIVVKTSQGKLANDVEPIINEITTTGKPAEIISIVMEDTGKSENANLDNKNTVVAASVIKNNDLHQSDLQQPLKGLKPIIQILEKQNFQQDNVSTKINVSKLVATDLKNESDTETELSPDNSGKIITEIKQKLESVKANTSNTIQENNTVLKNGFRKEFIPKIQNEMIPELKATTQKQNFVESSKIPTSKNIQSEYLVNPDLKSSNVKSQIKSSDFKINSETKSTVSTKLESKLAENEIIKPTNTISVKSNHKINSVSINKSTLQDKTVLNDLIEKTNVKEIDVNVHKFLKTSNVNIPKNFSGDQSKPIEIKTDAAISKTVFENKDLNNVDLNTQGVKQSITKNYSELVIVKQNKTANITNSEKQFASKPELNTKAVENTKVKNVPDYKPQQELFSENEIAENETKYLLKNESLKTNIASLKPIKEDFVINTDSSIKIGNKNLEKVSSIMSASIKTDDDQNPVDFKSNPHKPLNKIEFAAKENNDLNKSVTVEEKKIVLPEVKPVKTVSSKPLELKNDFESKQKPAEVRSNTQIVNPDIETEEIHITSTPKDSTNISVKDSINENVKEPLLVKTNLNTVRKESEKNNFVSDINAEKTAKIVKEQNVVDNSKKEFVELSESDVVNETVVKNLTETKNVKVDFMQRRVYSQIPNLEVFAEKAELKNVNNPKSLDLNVEPKNNEKVQTIDEPIKSISNSTETKPKIEKQVWVKVSLEKNDNEVASETRKSTHQQSKITIDSNSDEMKKDFTTNSNSEKESHENPKQKPQIVSIEAVQSNEQKPVVQNQTTTNQNETTVTVKPEMKTEQNVFKSELHNQETKFTSRQAEMVEKVKIISSGEMVREVYKVLESGEKQSIVLRLVPKELGAIKVMLDTIDNVLTAKVEVENESVGSVIRNNVDQLKHNLAQSGVYVNSINISYHNSDQKQHGFNNQKRKNPAYLENNELEDVDDTIVTKKMGYNTYEFLA